MTVGLAAHSVRDQQIHQGVAAFRERIQLQANQVRQAFDKSGFTQLRDVSVEIHPEWLCLRGNVSSYFLKQIAQVLAGRHAGDQAIQNDIMVSRHQRK